jgi:NADPH:quinone reductase-like Zn-dependent oxidoreductase
MAPKTMKAVEVVEKGKAEIREVPLPKLRDDYVLFKVKSVAVNPTDWWVALQLGTDPKLEKKKKNSFG